MTFKSQYRCIEQLLESRMFYLAVLCNTSAIITIRCQVSFYATIKNAIESTLFSLYIAQYTVMHKLNEMLSYGSHSEARFCCNTQAKSHFYSTLHFTSLQEER